MKKLIMSFVFSGILLSCSSGLEKADNLENLFATPENLSVSQPEVEIQEVRDENGDIIEFRPVVTITASADGAVYFGLKRSETDVNPVNSSDGFIEAVYPTGGTYESIVFAQGYQNAAETKVQVIIPEIPDIPLPNIDISDYYTFKSGDLNITPEGEITGVNIILTNTKVVIPNEIDGVVLTKIGNEAFRNSPITQIDFRFVAPGFEIGNASFRRTNLEYLRITKNIAAIGSSSFRQCFNLLAVDFESRNEVMTAIGDASFRQCTSLGSFVVPRFIERLERSIFRDCESLTDFSFQDGTKINFIGDNTFFGIDINVALPFPNYDNFLHWLDREGNILEAGATIGNEEYTAVFN
jgi:hypothetical protein